MASKKKSKKKAKKKVTRSRKTTAKKATAKKKVAKKKAAKKATAKKKTTKRAAAKKKPTRKKAARKASAAKKKSTTDNLRNRAAQAEIEVATEAPAAPAVPGGDAVTAALGGLAIPNVDLEGLDLAGVQESVKGIVDFVEDNPVAAAAVALGAGVVLTSLYWDKASGKK